MKALFILFLLSLSLPLNAQSEAIITMPEKEKLTCHVITHYELIKNPVSSTSIEWANYKDDVFTTTCQEDLQNQIDNALIDLKADIQDLVDSNYTNEYSIRTKGFKFNFIMESYDSVDYQDIWKICRTRNDVFRIRGENTYWDSEVAISSVDDGKGNFFYNECTQRNEAYPALYDADMCIEQVRCIVRNWNQSCREGINCTLDYTLEPQPKYKTIVGFDIKESNLSCSGSLPHCGEEEPLTPKRTNRKEKVPDPAPMPITKKTKSVSIPADDIAVPGDNDTASNGGSGDTPPTDPNQCIVDEPQVAFRLGKNGKNNAGHYLTADGCRDKISQPHWDAYDKNKNPILWKEVEEYYKQQENWPELPAYSGKIPPNVGYLEGPDGAMYVVKENGSAIVEKLNDKDQINAEWCINLGASASSCGHTIIGSEAGVRNNE